MEKVNTISFTSLEKAQIRIVIKDLTHIYKKYGIIKEEPKFVIQKEFNAAFNEILEGSTQRYLNPKTSKVSKKKTTIIEVLDKNGKCLIEYDTNKKNPYFWYQHDRVYMILKEKFLLHDENIQLLMESLVKTQYKIKGCYVHLVWL